VDGQHPAAKATDGRGHLISLGLAASVREWFATPGTSGGVAAEAENAKN